MTHSAESCIKQNKKKNGHDFSKLDSMTGCFSSSQHLVLKLPHSALQFPFLFFFIFANNMSVNFARMRKVHPSLHLHATLFSQWLLRRAVAKNLPLAMSQSAPRFLLSLSAKHVESPTKDHLWQGTKILYILLDFVFLQINCRFSQSFLERCRVIFLDD